MSDRLPAHVVLPKGFVLKHCPAFRVKARRVSVPRSSYDYLLVTSQNTVRSLKNLPRAQKIVVIGKKTEEALSIPARQLKVLKDSDSQGVLKFFLKMKERGTIFFPRSRKGDSRLVKQLRSQGYRVTVRHAYDLEMHPQFRRSMHRIMVEKSQKVFLVSSPSSFSFLLKAVGRAALREFPLVAIGTTTQTFIKSKGFQALRSKSATLESLIRMGLVCLRRV